MPEPTATAAKPPKPLSRKDLINRLSVATGVERDDVAAVLDALAATAGSELRRPDGPGAFMLPGLVRLKVVSRGATRERTARGPRGTPVLIPAKPARRAIHVKVYEPLKRSFATGGTEAVP
jgi:hypothetical protein